MAKGEARYQSAGKSVHRFDNKPIPVNDYQLQLLGEKEGLEVKKSEEKGPDAIPYINCRFRALGTAAKEGQKDRIVFHKFFLSLKPGTDAVIMPERGGGIVEFCRAGGEEADFATLTLQKSDGEEESYMDPEEVLEYLKGKVDRVFPAHVIIEAAKDRDGKKQVGHPGNNKIAHWNLDESQLTGETEEKEPAKPAAKAATPLKKAAGKK